MSALHLHFFFSLDIVVGFEMSSYTFEEPEFQSFTREQVCFELFEGRVDQTYRFRVQWNPVTAADGSSVVGGDYVPQSTTYVLDPGVQRTCIDILIQRDNAFERREEFTGQIMTVQLPDGRILPEAQGVTIQPSFTRVFIDNVDGKIKLVRCQDQGIYYLGCRTRNVSPKHNKGTILPEG